MALYVLFINLHIGIFIATVASAQHKIHSEFVLVCHIFTRIVCAIIGRLTRDHAVSKLRSVKNTIDAVDFR